MVDLLSACNIIDFSFLDRDEKSYTYVILIVLNRPILKELYYELKSKIDYVICADGAANRMHDNLNEENNTPDCIVGDFDSIRPEIQEFYAKRNVRLLKRSSVDTTDLEKCIYVGIEKNSEVSQEGKRSAIIILGSSGGRIDHTFSAYSNVFKYMPYCDEQSIDIYMLSRSSMSVYLKNGTNKIITTDWENREDGYSVIPIYGEGKVSITEYSEEEVHYNLEKEIKFGDAFLFRKRHSAKVIEMTVTKSKENVDTAFIYSFTTKYHNKA